jgi:diadenosine tetraphosphate (Ap4A) HIT family hydrolase
MVAYYNNMTEATVIPDCPFCRSNGLLKGQLLAEVPEAYLIDNYQFPGNYLIIPTVHVKSLLDLPDNWWHNVKSLLPQIPGLASNYNLSFNIGPHAGQTIAHLHLWIIPRAADQSSSGKGMISLLIDQDRPRT